ncbi:MAG: beta-ketoacyl-[acyl-carrier-protein] synthase II [Deltaproteobacteria bacterium CG2_30_43_15]|nr:MAG: beta-ketoacyl-[acyl-carrier-protein] synthase II [Deltaproteobacteria bacterium CG2_30_43_15]
MKRRVVVTGLGAVTPLGIGAEKTWKALCAGKSGIGRISRFDTTNFQTKIAGEVKDFDPEDFLDKKQVRRMDSFVHYCMAATIMAMEDSKLEVANQDAERIGVLIGTGLGGLPTLEKNHTLLIEGGPKKISPFFIPMMIANMAPGQIAIHFGIKGPNTCVITACAAGSHAIGDSYKVIQRGDADIMVAGGTEATITPLSIGGFNSMKAISTNNDEPEKASRPFDKNRDGFVPAEGAGTIILEELELALKRGANIYGEIVGYGLTSDAFHITAPDPQGSGAARCMKMALLDANILPSEVNYINAHGTSTPMNDTIETLAIKTVFNEYSKKIPVSSTKSMTGHLLGAAGGVEAVFTILTIRDGIIPPTINYETPDPDCDLDYVPNVARRADVRIAISNSFGFGGTNATLVFKRFEG